MNKNHLEHVTTGYSRMSREESQGIYHRVGMLLYAGAYRASMRRAAACGMSAGNVMFYCLWFFGCKTL